MEHLSLNSEKIVLFYRQKHCGLVACSRHFCIDIDTIYNVLKKGGITLNHPRADYRESYIEWNKRKLMLLQEHLVKACQKSIEVERKKQLLLQETLTKAYERSIKDAKRRHKKPNHTRSTAQKEAFYSDWRITVLVRDNFTCQDCKDADISLASLEVHHILPWKDNVNSRYDPENGVTLCKSCHRMRHKEMRTGIQTQRFNR